MPRKLGAKEEQVILHEKMDGSERGSSDTQ